MADVYHPDKLVSDIKAIIKSKSINVLYPAHDEIMELFSRTDWGDGIVVMAPPARVAEIVRYKKKTYEALYGAKFIPATYQLSEVSEEILPLFVRPDRGQGSVGVFKIGNLADIEKVSGDNDFIITEYLPGVEYTVDCYSATDGRLMYVCARERQRIRNGICVRAKELNDQEFNDIAICINEQIRPVGPWFFQVKRDGENNLKLMEVANRVAGSMGYQRLKGVNLVAASIWEALGNEVSFPRAPTGSFIYDRALSDGVKFYQLPESIYVDLDDTLILPSGSLNFELIGYLFGFRYNFNLPVVLVTRHGKNPLETLHAIGLSSPFTDMVHLKKDEPKSNSMHGEFFLFVDDSHKERNEVQSCFPQSVCIGPESQALLSGFFKGGN